MGRRDVATLAFRILGAYFFITGLVQVPGLIAFPFWLRTIQPKGSFGPTMLILVVGGALQLVIGILLWYLAGWLASLVFPHQEAPLATNGATSRQWLVVSLTVIGLFLVVESISRVAGIVGQHYAWFWKRGMALALGGLVGQLLQLAVGCVLLFGSSWIASRLACASPGEGAPPAPSRSGGAE